MHSQLDLIYLIKNVWHRDFALESSAYLHLGTETIWNKTSHHNMAPIPPRRPVAKDRFTALFSTLKVQTYHDPAARGPGSHTCVNGQYTDRYDV